MDAKSVELTSSIEDAFGFSLPDNQTPDPETVGDLYESVLVHRLHGRRAARLRNMAFYQIRRTLAAVLDIPRTDVRFSTDLSALIPRRRRRTWRAMRRASGLRLPSLCRPAWVVRAAFVATVVAAVAVPVHLSLSLLNGAILSALLTGFVVAHIAAWVTTPLAYELPPECSTVGELAAATLAHNYQTIVEASNGVSSDGIVWETVRGIVAGRLGVPAAAITQETPLGKSRPSLQTSSEALRSVETPKMTPSVVS